MPVLAGRRETNAQIELVNQQYIQESPHYLIAGSILGMLGFLIAVIPYLLRIFEHVFRGEDVPIEEVPPTVSELVSRWETVEARIFFGFELTSAYCILLSWYPYKLRRACCIPEAGGCLLHLGPCGSMHWATFRQFMPPVGLILVACCPTVSMRRLTLGDVPAARGGDGPQPGGEQAVPLLAGLLLVAVHCIAAMMMFVGFLMAEAHALCTKLYYPACCCGEGLCWRHVVFFECKTPTVEAGTREYRARSATWHVSAAGFLVFLLTQVLGVLGVIHMEKRRRYCVLSFLAEVIAGLAMLGNHMAIWYHSPERLWSRRGIVGDWTNATVQPLPISGSSVELRSVGSAAGAPSSFDGGAGAEQGADAPGPPGPAEPA